MQTFKTILIWVSILIISFIIAISVYLNIFGREAIQTYLSFCFNNKVTIGGIFYRPPFGVKVSNISIEGLAGIPEMSFVFDLKSIQRKNIIISYVHFDRPNIILPRKSIKQYLESAPVFTNKYFIQNENNSAAKTKKLSLEIEKLVVRNGKLVVLNGGEDRSTTFELNEIYFIIDKIAVPRTDGKTTFELSARFNRENILFSDRNIKCKGVIEFIGNDIKSNLNLLDVDEMVALKTDILLKEDILFVDGIIDLSINMISNSFLEKLTKVGSIIPSSINDETYNLLTRFNFETNISDFKIEKIVFSGSVRDRQDEAGAFK